jgi:hypothetical protein
MKKMMYVLAVAGLMGSVSASASQLPMPPYMPTYSAQLTTFDIDPSNPELRRVNGGMITRDQFRNKLRLTLFRKNDCRPPRLCIAMMPAPVIVVLPIKSVMQTRCGSTIYTAELDQRPVDGKLQTLQLSDNSARRCKDLRPGVEVRYTTKTSGMAGYEETFVSNFTGSPLMMDVIHHLGEEASE